MHILKHLPHDILESGLISNSPLIISRQCNITAGQFPCLKKGCFEEHQICDGRNDCEVS